MSMLKVSLINERAPAEEVQGILKPDAGHPGLVHLGVVAVDDPVLTICTPLGPPGPPPVALL